MTDELSEFAKTIKALKASPNKDRIIEAREKLGDVNTRTILDITYKEKIQYWNWEAKRAQESEDFKNGYKHKYFFNKFNSEQAKVELFTLRKYGLDGLLKILPTIH